MGLNLTSAYATVVWHQTNCNHLEAQFGRFYSEYTHVELLL